MRLFCLVVTAMLIAAIGLKGCNLSKPYIMNTDRVDQDMQAGNRGYLKGPPPPADDRSGLKRPLLAVDIDLPQIKGKPAKESKLVIGEKGQGQIK